MTLELTKPEIDCPNEGIEAARRRALYARSAAGSAELLWRDRAISHSELLSRVALQKAAERCLDRLLPPASGIQVGLLDGEQMGID